MPQMMCVGCRTLITVSTASGLDYLCSQCAEAKEPLKPYRLSENDRDFLRANRITPEV